MMFLTVIGIFALSYLPLHVRSGHLFLVDVTIPQREGRQEKEDIAFIDNALNSTTGISVHVARKFFDNQNVVLVLGVQETCHWSTLTSAFSEQGYELSVTPLQHCSEYAMGLNVRLTFTPSNILRSYDVINLFDIVYHDQGLTTDEYNDQMRKHFERAKLLLGKGNKAACYRSIGSLPARCLFFDDGDNSAQIDGIYKKIKNEAKAKIEVTLLQSFPSYTQTC